MGYWEEKSKYEKEHSCKICKKIVRGDQYPYQKTIFGRIKNYVCNDCNKRWNKDKVISKKLSNKLGGITYINGQGEICRT